MCLSFVALHLREEVSKVKKKDFEHLLMEVMQMWDFLLRILNQEVLESCSKLKIVNKLSLPASLGGISSGVCNSFIAGSA